jgi:hypothetical protein
VNPLVPVILGVVGAAISAVAATALARRQHSGKITTSDATDLWKEGKDMRDVLIAQVSRLEAVIVSLEAKIVALDTRLEAALGALRKGKDG